MNTLAARLARPLVAVLMVLAAQSSLALELTEGVQYKTLRPAVPTSVPAGKVEVVEAFWYACGHCYLLEPKLAAWEKKSKPANVELVRLPAMWNDVLKLHAQLFYTIEALRKPQLHAEVFREMNLRENRLETQAKIEAFLTSRGVSQAEFRKAFAGYWVDSKLRRAADLNKRYRITSTPTVVVNGKYVTDAGMAGGEDKLFQVINALAAREKPAT